MTDCNCPSGSIQPTQTRLVRNVNASCTPTGRTAPKTCTRKEWLQGIDCSNLCFSIDDCQLGAEQGAILKLPAVFKNGAGIAVDPIEPRITIKDPLGNVFLQSQGMTKEEVGVYFFLFGTNGDTQQGVWTAKITGVIEGVRVSDSYFFCVLPVGSIPFNLCGDGYGPLDGYGPDGYGDGYGGYGPSLEDGAGGFGTFAGREECGFDGGPDAGCSNDIPATGGCRTNRNETGDGFWDGISFEDTCITPIGKRGQCMKDRAVAMTRVRLKDIVPECVTGDTIVTTQLGHKRIDEIKEGDNLLVYYDKTKEYSYEPVREVLMNETKTGEIVTVTTKRGRKLRCTREHPLIGFDGEWVNAEDLKIGDRIAVNPLASTEMIRFDAEEVFFTYDQFEEMFPNIREQTKEQVKKWFPIQGQTAVIFARLIGFMFGDGHLTKDLGRANFASDCVEELDSIRRDLEHLEVAGICEIERKYKGITAQSVVEERNKKQHSGVSTYFEAINMGFAKTLAFLGVPSGDKAIQKYLIPDWIMENKWLLKNFLSAYYGADGCDILNSTGIRELNFSFNKNKDIDVTSFINQWKQAFVKFGIPLRVREEPNSGAIRKDGVVTTKWVLLPECSEAEAIIKFAEQIGCHYHSVKAHNLAMVAEYLREVEALKSEAENERQRVFDCLHDGLSRMEIVDEIHPNVDKKERAALWNKYDRWIRGNKEAIKLAIANTKKSNDAQQVIYSYVMDQSETRSHGEVARDIVERFEQEFDTCGMAAGYKSVWALVKSWRNGRVPDSKRYDYCPEDFDEMKAWSSAQVGIDYRDIPFDEWQEKYVVENRYFDEVASIKINKSDEDVYDCKFDAKYIFAESMVWGDCWAFCEDEIDMFLETSLADFNAWPTFTSYTWDTLPVNFLGVVVLGAQVFSLYAQGLLESGREFQITDNGISFSPPQISGYMQTTASALLAHYTELRETIKRNIKPQPNAIGTFRVLSLLPTLARLRHLRAKQII